MRRFTRRTRRRRITVIVVLGAVVLLFALVIGAVYSPFLALKTVTVEGTSRVSAADVKKAVADQVGTPLALLDFEKIKKNLGVFPLIRSYVTETVPPDTLVIRVAERAPIGAIATASGFSIVDPAGVPLSKSAERPPGIPVIDVGNAKPDSAAFHSAVQVLLALPSDLLAKVDRVTAQTNDDVTLVLTGAGQSVVWGSADNSR